MIVASMGIVTARLCDAPPLRSANDRSRWCTVWALVERNTYQIDEIRQKKGWDTIDIVRNDGHFYSSKPPLLPRMVAELYRGLKRVTGWTLTEQTEAVTRSLLFLINVVPMGFALWYFSGLVKDYCRDPFGQLFIIACGCFGTLLIPYLTVFNNHTIAATAFFIALPMTVRCLALDGQQYWRFAVSGLLTSFGICNELPAALLGLGFFAILLQVSVSRTLFVFVPAALIPIAGFFYTNHEATGSWKPFYAGYGTKTYVYEHEGVPSYWSDPKGIDQPRDSTPYYLMHCVIGHHGILSLTPIYLISLWGWIWPRYFWRSRLWVFQCLGMALTAATLGFYLTKTENYNYSGASVALRWMLWLTPFWLLAMFPVLSRWGRFATFRGVAMALLAVSVFSAAYPSNAPWAKNWIFQLMEEAKWINYTDPTPPFKQKHFTWIGKLPTGELQPDYWIRYGSTSAIGIPEEIEFKDAGPAPNGRRLVSVRLSTAGQTTSEVMYLFDVARFNAGMPVEDFLLGRQDGEKPSEADLLFFRGMPRKMQYLASRTRYEKTPLRTDAFRCQVGYTYVTEKPENQLPRQIVRDVWYCEEVPFGTLKWEERVQDGKTSEVLVRQLWQPIAAGRYFDRAAESEF